MLSTKKTSQSHITGHVWGRPSVTGEFPSQRTSNAENGVINMHSHFLCFVCGSHAMYFKVSLRWRHNGHDGVSNHQPHHCLLNRLFGCRSKIKQNHQSSTSLAFVLGIHRRSVNSPHKWPVTRKMFTFDDVIMLIWHNNPYSSGCFAAAGTIV